MKSLQEIALDLSRTGATIAGEVQQLLKQGKPHSFSRDLFNRLGLTEVNFSDFVDKALTSTVTSLARTEMTCSSRLPKTSHRVWITDPQNPHLPPQSYLISILQQQREAPDWDHAFWTNSLDVIRHVDALAEQQGNASFGRLLANHFSDDLLYPAISEFIAASKFVGASDLARIMVLYRSGGLYCDMGVVYSREFLELASHSGAVLNVDMQLMFQLAVLGFPTLDPFMSLWYQLCLHPGIFTAPLYPDGQEFRAIEELSFLSGPGFTAMVLHFLNPTRPVLVVPQQGRLLHIGSQKSWYGTAGKFGNVIVSKTPPTRLVASAHATWRSVLKNLPTSEPKEAIKALCEISSNSN